MREGLSKEDWEVGFTEDTVPRGPSAGCMLVIACVLLVDVLAVWALYQLAQFAAWLLALLASA